MHAAHPHSESKAAVRRAVGGRGCRLIAFQALVAAVAMTAVSGSLARAGERRFTFVQEATTAPKGKLEFENWVTWLGPKDEDGRFSRVDFRHELEFGLTDRLQVALYLADWAYQDGRDVERRGFFYKDSALELKLNLTNPTSDPVGLAVYAEYALGPDFHKLEAKAIAQKNIGPFVLAYNAIGEVEWERKQGSFESAAEFSQTAGISCEVAPSLTVGAELLHEVEWPNWGRVEPQRLYVGPNASYRHGRWWVTVTPLLQITHASGEPDFQVRVIFGVNF